MEFKGTKAIPNFKHRGKEVVYKDLADELLEACMEVCNADTQFKLREARVKCKQAIEKALK